MKLPYTGIVIVSHSEERLENFYSPLGDSRGYV